MSLLQDYELEGRWLFVRMDSVDIFRKDWYEVIHPKTFYDCYTDHFTNITKEFFIYSLYRDITNREEFARFPPSPHSLQGVRVDVKRYKILNKLPLNILLATYFNKDKRLKKIYEKLLYEIIAACYTKNVKVITPTQGSAYYEIFK